jgi:hypothetical protein
MERYCKIIRAHKPFGRISGEEIIAKSL